MFRTRSQINISAFLLLLLLASLIIVGPKFAVAAGQPDAPAQTLARQGTGSIIGEASVVVVDDFETGETRLQYFIIDRQSRKSSEVFFKGSADQNFRTGNIVRLYGTARANGLEIDITSMEVIKDSRTDSKIDNLGEQDVEAPLATQEIRKVLTLIVDFNDAVNHDYSTPANTPYGPTVQDIKDRMFHNVKNIADFYDKASLGTLNIPSDPNNLGEDAVYGPYKINYNYLGGNESQCLFFEWLEASLDLWEADTGQNRLDYQHHSLIVPNWHDRANSYRNCSWAGVGTLGCGENCFTFSSGSVTSPDGFDPFPVELVVAHELGHNFSLHHARTDQDNSGTTDEEYGDASDIMGASSGWKKFNPPHFEYKGWYDQTSYELRTIIPPSNLQSFELIPTDEENTEWPGLRALKTSRTASTNYYLSYRQQTGHYDGVPLGYTTGASLHWGDGSSYSYFIRIIGPGETFVDTAAGLVIQGVGPTIVDNVDFTDTTQAFTLKVCSTTCSTLLRPLQPVARGISHNSILLTWQDYTYNEHGFAIEYSLDGSIWSQAGTAAADSVSYIHSGLDVETTYYYRARATRGGSEFSDWSDIVFAVTPSTSPELAPDLTPATDTGVSDSDNITTDSTPGFYVACSGKGNTITLYTDNPATYPAVGSHICKATGIEVATATKALEVGMHHIVYTEKMGRGKKESGHSPSLEVTIDPPADSDHFVTTWHTGNPGLTGSTSIKLPMVGGPYDVDWDNDGEFDEFGIYGSVIHDFGAVGTYTIRVRGAYSSFSFRVDDGFFGSYEDAAKILSIDQWGTKSWTSMETAFSHAVNLEVLATDTPDFSAVKSMAWMFTLAGLANPDTSNWETGAVTDMTGMFSQAASANPDTSGWDTSAVRDMTYMFYSATAFNQDLGSWDVTALEWAFWMFEGVTLSTANYESLLIGWNAQSLKLGVVFSGGNSNYCSTAASSAKDNMTISDGWIITDGGQACSPVIFSNGFED